MEDEAEYSGKTVEAAISRAEITLGAGRDSLQIEVISQGSRGVFGIGAESARIRASRRTPTDQAPPLESEVAWSEDLTPSPVSETSADTSTAVATPAQEAALAGEAREVLQQLLRHMGFDAEVTVRETENPLILAITGQDLGVLIGRRGDNLSALQFMVNLILSKNRRQWPRVVVDVEDYRARREDSLSTLADRIAYRVANGGRPFTLEAMTASDRRIIHLTLRDRQDVETYSIGEGPARRVVVAPKRG